jgi:capsular exopolysaccharide synthesis family protein
MRQEIVNSRSLAPLGMSPRSSREAGRGDDEELAPALDLRALIQTIRGHLKLVIASTVCGVLIAGWVGSRAPAVYQASAVIRLEDKTRSLTGGLVGDPTRAMVGRSVDPLLSQVEILTSRAVAETVVDSTPMLRVQTEGYSPLIIRNLFLRPDLDRRTLQVEFGPSWYTVADTNARTTAAYGNGMVVNGVHFTLTTRPEKAKGVLRIISREDAATRLLGALSVRPRVNTDVVDVILKAPDPYLAQIVVNRVVRVFTSVNAAAAQQEAHLRREFLEKQLRLNDSLLSEARSSLTSFRGRVRTFSTQERFSTRESDAGGLRVRRQELDAERRTYRGLLETLSHAEAGGQDEALRSLVASPEIAINPVVSGLYDQLSKYELTRDSMTTGAWASSSQNPDVQQVNALIKSTKAKLASAVQSVIAALDAKVSAFDTLQAQNSAGFQRLSLDEAEETNLTERVEMARKVADELRAEYQKAQLAEAVEVGQVEIVDSAALSKKPIGFRLRMRLAFGFLLGMILGIGAALAMEHMNTSVRRRGQVQSMLHLTELAVIPPVVSRRRALTNGASTASSRAIGLKHAPPKRIADGLVVASDMHSIAAEAYRLLRTNLIFSLPDRTLKSVLVTSPAPGDGKTTVAANLAIAFAHQGMRVLLIDADLRRGRIHDLFHAERDPGLSQVLQGVMKLEDAVRVTPVTGLFLLPTGKIPADPSELVGDSRMRELLQRLVSDYAVVVIDSPPVLAVSDAAVLSTLTDATVVVVRAGRTNEEEAQAALDQIAGVGGHVVGAVLNDPDAAISRYGGYYYSKYYGPER